MYLIELIYLNIERTGAAREAVYQTHACYS